MTSMQERAKSIRPNDSDKMIQTTTEESGDVDAENESIEKEEDEGQDQEWKVVADRVEDLTRKVAEYMDDEQAEGRQAPPMVKAPRQPTKEEYERHQTTHTPYEPWCRHCAAARARENTAPD